MTNFNDTTPAAPAGTVNIKWQADGSGNISANVSQSATALQHPVRVVTAATDTITLADYLVEASAVSNAITETLPAGLTSAQTVDFVVKKIDSSANAVTVSSASNIDGAATVVLTSQNDFVAVQWDGSTYQIKAVKIAKAGITPSTLTVSGATALNGTATLGATLVLNGQTVSGTANFTGTPVFTGSSEPLRITSGATGTFVTAGFARGGADEMVIGVAALSAQFFGSVGAGDAILRCNSGSNFLHLGSGSGTSGIQISGSATQINLPVTGTMGGWQTWSPGISGFGSMTCSATSITEAVYMRIGPMVFFKISGLTTFGGTASTAMNITGLPVTNAGQATAVSCLLSPTDNSHLSSAVATVQPSATNIGVSLNGEGNFSLIQYYFWLEGFYQV